MVVDQLSKPMRELSLASLSWVDIALKSDSCVDPFQNQGVRGKGDQNVPSIEVGPFPSPS